jgi:glycosyltransferase involved in cell wall biosynthesis
LDYELISALAHATDAWSIVMVGPVQGIDPDRLPRRHNLFWLGQRPHPEMPDYAHGFRVCIAPFAASAATQFHRPVKLNEYLRSGRPVVCTDLEEVRQDFKGLVNIAHSHEEFIELCKKAVEAPDQEMIRRGSEVTSKRAWHRLTNAMEGWINETLEAKNPDASVSIGSTAQS